MQAKTRPLAFICSPFRSHTETEARENFNIMQKMMRMAIDAGYAPFPPHALYPIVLDDSIEEERDLGIECGLSVMSLCSKVFIYKERISKGMEQEIEQARSMLIPLEYVSVELS